MTFQQMESTRSNPAICFVAQTVAQVSCPWVSMEMAPETRGRDAHAVACKRFSRDSSEKAHGPQDARAPEMLLPGAASKSIAPVIFIVFRLGNLDSGNHYGTRLCSFTGNHPPAFYPRLCHRCLCPHFVIRCGVRESAAFPADPADRPGPVPVTAGSKLVVRGKISSRCFEAEF